MVSLTYGRRSKEFFIRSKVKMPPRRRRCVRRRCPSRRHVAPATSGAYHRRVSRRYRRRTGGKFKDTMKKIGKSVLEVLKIVPRMMNVNV